MIAYEQLLNQDLADVQELIDLLRLPQEFSGELNPFVRDKFHELWNIVHSNSA